RAGGSARLFGQSGTPGGPGGIDEPRGDFVWAPCSRRWTCNFDHGADAPHGVDDRRDSRADGRPRLATWWQRVIAAPIDFPVWAILTTVWDHMTVWDHEHL